MGFFFCIPDYQFDYQPLVRLAGCRRVASADFLHFAKQIQRSLRRSSSPTPNLPNFRIIPASVPDPVGSPRSAIVRSFPLAGIGQLVAVATREDARAPDIQQGHTPGQPIIHGRYTKEAVAQRREWLDVVRELQRLIELAEQRSPL